VYHCLGGTCCLHFTSPHVDCSLYSATIKHFMHSDTLNYCSFLRPYNICKFVGYAHLKFNGFKNKTSVFASVTNFMEQSRS
jgi:hypothetical protein